MVLVSRDEVFARRIDIDLAASGWDVIHAEDAEHTVVGDATAVVVDGGARGANWRLLDGVQRTAATAVLPVVAVLEAPMPADVLRVLNSGAAAWVARDETHDGLEPALERAMDEPRRPGAT